MTTIGKVSVIRRERDFEWRIEDFSALSEECDVHYDSPSFTFAGEYWYLQIFPNGEKEDESPEYIGLYLMRKSPLPPISVDYSLNLKTKDGITVAERDCGKDTFKEAVKGWGYPKFIKRSEFLIRGSELGLPVGLTVICTMKYVQNTADASKTVTAVCSFCKKTFNAKNIPSHEARCLEKPLKCPECCNVLKLKDWYDHECQKAEPKASDKLSRDLQSMVLSGDHSDTIVKVKAEEFQLHRGILAARNAYFHSMFKTDMKEKNTGVVSVDDCEPDIFRTFVHFIYTGKVDKLSSENVCELYKVADKYQDNELKEECLHFMMEEMSEATFCDFMVLALKYDEKKLFEKAVESFISKPDVIVRSVEWQNFAKEYPTQANELFVKIVDRYYVK